MRQHLIAALAVNHAVEIVAPLRQAPRAAIAQGDEIESGDAVSERLHLLVRHVPHHHGVGRVAELVVPHHHAEAADHATVLQVREPLNDLRLGQLQLRRDPGIGTRHEWQAVLNGSEQPPVAIIHRGTAPLDDLALLRWKRILVEPGFHSLSSNPRSM